MQYSTVEARQAIDAGKLTPEWQNRLARQMAEEFRTSAGKEASSPPHAVTWTAWKLGVVTSILLITAGSILFRILPGKEHTEIESLLAKAYSEHRTIEARIPGAPHSELTITKGGTQSPLNILAKPAGAITSLCENKPGNAKCLLYEARLNLLDWQYKVALTDLEKIDPTTQLTKTERKDFLINHALALFEKGKKEKEVQPPAEPYKAAAEDLSQLLANESHDAVALFNRALIYEELQMPESARVDWEQLIRIEKDSGWKNEAQRHLDAIEGKKKPAS